MKNKKRLVISFVLVFFIFGVSLPLFITNHRKVKADTITNLINTTWLLNDTINTNMTASINFTSNSNSYTSFNSHYDWGMDWQYITYNSTDVYVNGWVNQAYRTIYITGGADVSSSTLISWLQNNAVEQAPAPVGTEITHRYWSIATGFRMNNDVEYHDDEIQYTILFNEQKREYDETIQTGLAFKGPTTENNSCYMFSISPLNILYESDDDRFLTSCWFEFTTGDYIDEDLYNFMSSIGHWFDDADAYLCGTSQGYVEGKADGRALGQADGVEYTNLISNIFNGIGGLLSIQVFPNITIALLIGLPLLLGVLVIILKILRG